jgi:DNA-binding transcriptional LysR family regulator
LFGGFVRCDQVVSGAKLVRCLWYTFPTLRCASIHADALIAAAIRGCGLVLLEDYMLARHFEAGRLVEMLRPFTADGGNGAPRTIEFCLTPKTLEHYLLAA